MTKIIRIPVDEKLYFETLELKAKLKANDWNDFLLKLVEKVKG